MDCKQFTYIIEYFNFHSIKLDVFWNNGHPADRDLEILLPMTEEIQSNLDQVCNPASLFLDQLEDDQWRLLFQMVGPDIMNEDMTIYQVIEHLFKINAPAMFIKSEEDLMIALAELWLKLQEKVGSLYDSNEIERENIDRRLKTYCRMFRSVLLNLVFEKKPLINLEGINPQYYNNGMFLRPGVLLATRLEKQGGAHSGGTIIVEDGGEDLGFDKLCGVIIAQKASGSVGVTAQERPSRATILVEDASRLMSARCKARLYKFQANTTVPLGTNPSPSVWQPKLGGYLDVEDLKRIPVLKTSDELHAFIEGKSGLVLIDERRFDEVDETTLTENFEDGIMVLRRLPSGNLGKGMRGGVIIIETNNSLEEIQAVLSDEYIPGRGIILRRVPDQKNKGETELEVVYPRKKVYKVESS